MLVRDQDFAVEKKRGIIRCTPKNADASSAFKVLQLAMQKLLPQLPDPPAVVIEVDGVVGPSLTLATQVVAQRLTDGVHKGLAELCGLQPEEAIPQIATFCMEITGYIEKVLDVDPTALIAPKSQPMGEPIDPMATLKNLFTTKRIAAVAGTFVGIAVFVGLGAMMQRRSMGTADRSSTLPPSDGTDEFEEEAEEEATTYTTAYEPAPFVPTGRVIDAEATEVTSRAA